MPDGGNQPDVYKIRIQGQLDEMWSEWFEGLTVSWDDEGNTLLTGPVVDQSALHGLLRRVRDLGIPLISVERLNQPQFGTQENLDPC
jgi:hypothetical protein